MDVTTVWEELVEPRQKGKIIYLIMDGVGGLSFPGRNGTALEVARTPNLDRMASVSSCGLLEMVGPGITPGSGPGHLALFGYDPLTYEIGRGVLSALGIDFDLQVGDVAARINFATVSEDGSITDRRAGRISTDENVRLCRKLREGIELEGDTTFYLETVAEHRAVLVLRGTYLGSRIEDTDPQELGVPPRKVSASSEDSRKTETVVSSLVEQATDLLASEGKANMILLRGFEKYSPLPSLQERFGLKPVCVAEYPMYRGISRLLGMDVPAKPEGIAGTFSCLGEYYREDYDFFFVHIKKTDSYGEDGDFDRKVEVIEETDRHLPAVLELEPEVAVVTGDHSTPALMKMHSWHPVPCMLKSRLSRGDPVERFDEKSCIGGALGLRPGVHLIGLAMAHANRLTKFGA